MTKLYEILIKVDEMRAWKVVSLVKNKTKIEIWQVESPIKFWQNLQNKH